MADDSFNAIPSYVRDPMVANIRRTNPIVQTFVVVELKKEFAAIATSGSSATLLAKAHKAAMAKMSGNP